MGLMTTLRTRMTVVLWALLILFLLSMAVGGLVGGANIIDQIAGRVDPSRVIARINDQDISPDYFNNLVKIIYIEGSKNRKKSDKRMNYFLF